MPNPKGDNHRGLYARILANTKQDPDNDRGCWLWTGERRSRYPTMSIRIRGKHCKVNVHRVVLALMELEGETELLPDLLDNYREAGFEADHLCFYQPRCVNPDHLQWLTKDEHQEKTYKQKHPDQPAARSGSG